MPNVRSGLAVLALAAVCLATTARASRHQIPAVGTGRIEVQVTFDGAPVANATVCAGTAQDRNLFFQGRTNAQGRVSISPIPAQPYVVTANTSTRTAQVSRTPLTGGPSLVPLTLVLQPGTSARCPTAIAAGPYRKFVDAVDPPTQTIGPASLTPIGRTEFCFGAVGMGCGQVLPGLPLAAACAGGHCAINGGSWDHDTCCYASPSGYACAGGAADLTGFGPGSGTSTCRAEWDKAVRLTTKGLSWTRSVDFSRGNATGTVEHALYCAPAGTLVPSADAGKCCARTTRALTTAEQTIATARGETLRACQ